MKRKTAQTIAGLITIAILIFSILSTCKAETPLTMIKYRVQAGDTLWGIAQEHAPKGADIREYIYNTKKHNGLKNSNICPGMLLEITTEAE